MVCQVPKPAAERPDPAGVDPLVVGAPTHNRGLPGPGSRKEARAKGGEGEDFGVAEWLPTLPPATAARAAAFDTVTGLGFFSGSAAKRIAILLRRRGLTVVDRANFLAGDQQGPLADDELARAHQWGASLVRVPFARRPKPGRSAHRAERIHDLDAANAASGTQVLGPHLRA